MWMLDLRQVRQQPQRRLLQQGRGILIDVVYSDVRNNFMGRVVVGSEASQRA